MDERPERTETDAGDLPDGPLRDDLALFEEAPATAELGHELPTIDPSNYVVHGEVARGGMGRILRATDRRLDRPVAIKLLLVDSPRLRRLFEREARIAAKLQHPSIVNVYEAGRLPSGELFYAMKLVAGRSLAEVIGAAHSLEQRLALVPAVAAVCDALAYAHEQGIIHRDLKPGNVLVGDFGETVVIDWGIAKDLRAPTEPGGATTPEQPSADTASGHVMGTPAFMAPEQANREPVAETCDVYSLGAILYHLLSGTPPFRGDDILDQVRAGPPPPLATVQSGIPRDLLTIVDRAMRRYPRDRYPSAVELAADLRRFLTGQLVAAHDYSRHELFGRWLQRHRAPVSVAVLALAVVAVLSTIGIRRIVRERDVAASRADRLVLAQARLMLERDPAEAVRTLSTLSMRSTDWGAARVLAAEARRRGIGVTAVRHAAAVTHVVSARDQPVAASASTSGEVVLSVGNEPPVSLGHHSGEVTALAVDSAGAMIVSAGRDHTLRLYDRRSGSTRTLPGHTAPVLAARFAADAPVLLSGDQTGVIRVWDTRTWTSRSLLAHRGAVTQLAVSATGTYAASLDTAGNARVWRLAASARLLKAFDAKVSALAFAPHSDLLAVATSEGLSALSLPLGAATPLGHLDGVRFVGFARPGQLVAATTDGTLLAISMQTRKRTVFRRGVRIRALAISSDGRRIASAGGDRKIRVWTSGGRPVGVFVGHRGAISALAFAGTGRGLLSGADDQTVRRWALRPRAVANLIGHRGWVTHVRFTPDGQTLISSGWGFTIGVWDVATGDPTWLRGHGGAVRDIAVSADGTHLASVSDDRSVRLWNLHTKTGALLGTHQSAALSVAISADGKLVASGGRDGAVRVWPVDGGAPMTLRGHRDSVTSVAFSPNGAYVASASSDHTARLWRLGTGGSRVIEHVDALTHATFSHDGRWLAVSSRDHDVSLVPVGGGATRRLRGHRGPVRHVAFSRDDQHLASASDDKTIRVWRLSGALEHTLRGHQDFVSRVVFDPRGHALASASEDGTARIWDLDSGESRVIGSGKWLADVAWAPTGTWVATSGADAVVRLWRDDLPHDRRRLRRWLQAAAPTPHRAGDGG